MKIRNIWKNVKEPLELHTDDRGSIVDLFYNEDINHVATVTSEPYVIRGNHYHKETTQHMLMIKGSLVVVAAEGDLVSTGPNEIHALRIGSEGNEFVVFSQGKRGGKDYESDTFRVDNIIED